VSNWRNQKSKGTKGRTFSESAARLMKKGGAERVEVMGAVESIVLPMEGEGNHASSSCQLNTKEERSTAIFPVLRRWIRGKSWEKGMDANDVKTQRSIVMKTCDWEAL